MKTLLTLLEKELWEYRIVVKLPLFLALFAVLNFAFVMMGDNVTFSIQSSGNGLIDWGLTQDGFAGLIGKLNVLIAGMLYLILFMIYVPKTLRKEKQEGSLMFWRSMPVSDHLTVGAKLIFILGVVPLIASCLLIFSDLVVWLLAMLWLPADMMQSMHISLPSIALHWGQFMGTLTLMSLALLPLACGLLVVSQLTRYPLLTVMFVIVIIKIALFQATGSGELGRQLTDIYWLPVDILISGSSLDAYLAFGTVANGFMLVAGIALYFVTCWLRGRDDATKAV
ncbi:ABC transporter [Photobacterium japonica]|uniref:ABC transporter n=1 Tax=Photobacterium japonica TaxID=2910235 RepID=UPI003D0C9755